MAHRNMVGGTAYDTTGGRALVDGTVYSIQKGKTMVDGTVREIGFSTVPEGPWLQSNSYDNRNGAEVSISETESALSGSARGGSGTNYSGVEWFLMNGEERYQLPKGDTVTFAFSGTYGGNVDNATYGIAFFTNPDSAWNSYVYTKFNSSTTTAGVTYRVSTPCYCMLLAQIGGVDNNNSYATINITKFQVNGETVWSE